MKTLDLNDPKDARTFITEAIAEVLTETVGSGASHAILADGTKKDLRNLSDSEAVDYAYQLLPIFQARYPDNVKLEREH